MLKLEFLRFGERALGKRSQAAVEHQRSEHHMLQENSALREIETRGGDRVCLDLADVVQQSAGGYEVDVCRASPSPRRARWCQLPRRAAAIRRSARDVRAPRRAHARTARGTHRRRKTNPLRAGASAISVPAAIYPRYPKASRHRRSRAAGIRRCSPPTRATTRSGALILSWRRP